MLWDDEMQYDEFSAMSTTVLSAAEGDPQRVAAGFRAVRAWVAECEQRYSRFLPDSELCRLNRAAGEWFPASPGLFELVETALELHDLTDGLFDPAILPALEQSGYDRSIELIRQTGDQPEGREKRALPAGRFTETRLDHERQAIRLPDGVQIDLGGVAKGWIVERAGQLLHTYSRACAVEAGGDMALRGHPASSEAYPADEAVFGNGALPALGQQPGWRIALEDPRDPEQTLAVMQVGPGAVVTSSIMRRRWTQNGRPRHHIIDPRTGRPAEEIWLSVTVFAARATTAEAFAKALLLTSPEGAIALARRVPELRFICVKPDGSLWGAPESMEILDVPEPIY